ncbi:MAG: 3-isopropylmalate dehydratase large subunit [Anaerolineaceae bacterium]|nr:3-isopropylmalate dehydratase large subunit [Anaerolineaceae bacterium]
MGMTFAEKILAKKSGSTWVEPGQIVTVVPDVLLSHDNSAPISQIFRKMGGERLFNPNLNVIVLDHAAPAPTTKHAENHRVTREFVREQGIQHFYDVGRGICHQVLVEEGLALPGEIVLGSDSHTIHAGAMGAFGSGIGRSEMASIWAVGQIWLRVPESMKVVVHGKLAPDVTTKDLALHVIGDLGSDGGLYKSVEWHGEAIESLSVSERSVLTNMMGEMGAKNSYIAPGEKVFKYLQNRAKRAFQAVFPDPDASYVQEVEYDAQEIVPMIACPHTVDNVKPLSEIAGVKIDQAYLGTCTNGRLDDLAEAAAVLEGRKLSPGTRLIILPASSEIYQQAIDAGYISTFLKSGAVIESPGCGACMGNHMGVPAVGEVTISTANRNFRGRMGTKESDIYLANPAVVAASAVAGKIIHPADLPCLSE